MTARFELDHLSIGVRRPLAAARVLRGELGAEPLIGGVLPEFRYLLMHVGDVQGERVVGGRLELISTPDDPDHQDTGFMGRFLARHGESAHHLSFNVPDLPPVREALHEAGFRTVQEDLDFPGWQEVFVPPDALHGVLVQVASTPTPIRTRELFGTTRRDWSTLPNNRDAVDPGWWEQLWEVPVPGSHSTVTPDGGRTDAANPGGARQPIGRATLGPVVLGTSDLDRSDLLFGQILHGTPTRLDGALSNGARSYAWPTGTLVVVEGKPGVRGAVCALPTSVRGTAGPTREGDWHVGAVRLSAELEDLL